MHLLSDVLSMKNALEVCGNTGLFVGSGRSLPRRLARLSPSSSEGGVLFD